MPPQPWPLSAEDVVRWREHKRSRGRDPDAGRMEISQENLSLLTCPMAISGSQDTWAPVPAWPSFVLLVILPFPGLTVLICVMETCGQPVHGVVPRIQKPNAKAGSRCCKGWACMGPVRGVKCCEHRGLETPRLVVGTEMEASSSKT